MHEPLVLVLVFSIWEFRGRSIPLSGGAFGIDQLVGALRAVFIDMVGHWVCCGWKLRYLSLLPASEGCAQQQRHWKADYPVSHMVDGFGADGRRRGVQFAMCSARRR